MFRFIAKKLRYMALKNKNMEQTTDDKPGEPLDTSLQTNLTAIKGMIFNSADIVIHEFSFGKERKQYGAVMYIENLANKSEIHKNILQPLMYDSLLISGNANIDYSDIDSIQRNLLSITDNTQLTKTSEVLDKLLSGSTILLINKSKVALAINTKRTESRSIREPETENVVRGPREGFNENASVSLALIRRKIKDPYLCVENMILGNKSRTDIYIVYLKSIANPKLVDEVKIRLKKIKIDAILESGYIEQFIEDAPYSIFSTVSNSEKPDKVAAKILEGRVAVLVDGTPFVLAVPMLFVSSFQSEEDYYSRPYFASVIRMIRFLAYSISVLAPATYVALTVFHQELIPTQLLISIAAGRNNVPFPAILEAFLMILTFDILREAGVRLPKPVGQTVSIVGALVLGQAAVEAGLISPLMVIVVATTAISSFVVPTQIDSGTVLRYIYLGLAGISGGFGIVMGLLVTLIHLSSLRSFGTPYLWPIAPVDFSGLKDVFVRMPLWTMLKRPKAVTWNNNDSYRQASGMKPAPENKTVDSKGDN